MKSVIEKRSFEFSVLCVEEYKRLTEKKEYVLSKQFLRSSTSIGANVSEAQFAQSTKDFISKMSIALKEASETKYWIRLLERTKYLESKNYKILIDEINQIIRMLVKIVNTSKKNGS